MVHYTKEEVEERWDVPKLEVTWDCAVYVTSSGKPLGELCKTKFVGGELKAVDGVTGAELTIRRHAACYELEWPSGEVQVIER